MRIKISMWANCSRKIHTRQCKRLQVRVLSVQIGITNIKTWCIPAWQKGFIYKPVAWIEPKVKPINVKRSIHTWNSREQSRKLAFSGKIIEFVEFIFRVLRLLQLNRSSFRCKFHKINFSSNFTTSKASANSIGVASIERPSRQCVKYTYIDVCTHAHLQATLNHKNIQSLKSKQCIVCVCVRACICVCEAKETNCWVCSHLAVRMFVAARIGRAIVLS